MKKIIDFNKTLYELCNDDPKVSDILAEVGFTDITKPGMLSTAGRFMTINKGSAHKNINLEVIKQAFKDTGYEIKE